jgi:hypothetical protein
MDSPRVLVGFGRWPKGGRMLSIVVKIMPLGKNKPRSPPSSSEPNIIGQPSPLIAGTIQVGLSPPIFATLRHAR